MLVAITYHHCCCACALLHLTALQPGGLVHSLHSLQRESYVEYVIKTVIHAKVRHIVFCKYAAESYFPTM